MSAWHEAGFACDPKPAGASTRWVTRERPKIDRTACPWLISRFIDRDAEFLYVPAADVREVAQTRDAVAYDVSGVHFSHEGERCSFDAFSGPLSSCSRSRCRAAQGPLCRRSRFAERRASLQPMKRLRSHALARSTIATRMSMAMITVSACGC